MGFQQIFQFFRPQDLGFLLGLFIVLIFNIFGHFLSYLRFRFDWFE